ncbi:hypothetical protein SAMN04515679_2385 [Pelosinus fermentans]|uniref:Uncharacterized protein n=1 Tax=Pelosinus fermentans B4 TaxID=1149862 RepID=I8RJH2_9FIRM|nr:hypothetical protein FB4_3479 [Pelosinus fermentans B4]EIW24291.1 hypothetical protein FA11_3480 [Pelosinus fermentans A11]OAM94263.1 hypothetical protein FR7_02281 [Pelosinus fermentans DSM 17108]SDR04530.1 hypothetical protein SAMN04515679_2385 [Pelosinus fermentans]
MAKKGKNFLAIHWNLKPKQFAYAKKKNISIEP